MTSAATITAGTLGPGNVITIEAYGSYVDPVPSAPDATFKLKLGSTTIYTDTETVGGGRWRIRALITVRTAGTSGTVVGTVVISLLFPPPPKPQPSTPRHHWQWISAPPSPTPPAKKPSTAIS